MKKRVLLFFVLFNIIFNFYSQDKDQTADEKLSWKEKSEVFKKKVLAKDLAYADFAQLKSMAMALGLEENDTAVGYRNALSKFYNLKLFEIKNKKGDIIVLERAGELKMFKVKEEDEENLHITGRAKLVINNKDENSQNVSRTVEADDIYIDLKNKEITGIGNVYFKDDGLEFQGEQFYFNFNINRGVLFEGRTKILKSGDSGLKDAYFIGERIVQSNKDDAILYNGNLTTCDSENPHYYIKVSKIWINQNGEWGILNGVLYLGPIPFLYIPIYYHPKDLIINPVFGYKSREGWGLNTTYFILGKKSESKSSEKDVFGIEKNRAEPAGDKSLFRLTKAEIDNKLTDFYDKYEFYKKYPQFKSFPQINGMDFALRGFADAYTNLGFYFGGFYYMKVDSQASPFTMVMLSDFAFSRLLWKNPEAEGYLPYNPVHKTRSIGFEDKFGYIHSFSKRNTFYHIDANPLTFRTSQWLKMSGNVNKSIKNQSLRFNYEAYIEYASDENYFRDFYARKLSFTYIDVVFDALKYSIDAQNQKMSNFTTEQDETTSSKTEIKNYIKTDFTPPKIPSLFGIDLVGNVKLNVNSTLTLRSTYVADYAPNSSESDKRYNGGVDDPRYKRYMFDILTLPETIFSMDGVLLDYNAFVNMPTKIVESRKKEGKSDQIQIEDLYVNIENIKNLDVSKDSKEIDYKEMFVFYSRKNVTDKNSSIDKDYKFKEPVKNGEDFTYKKDDKKEKEKKSEKNKDYLKEEYFNPKKVEKEANQSYPQIKPINFNLKYSFNNNFTNAFKFKPDVSSDNEYDSIQKLFLNKFNAQKNIEKFYFNEDLTFRLNGSLQLMTFGSNSLFQTMPAFEVRYVKWYDTNEYYKNYLEEIYGTLAKSIPKATFEDIVNRLTDVNDSNFLKTLYTLASVNSTHYTLKSSITDYEKETATSIFKKAGYENPDITSRVEVYEKGNKNKSEFKMYYNDTITNDLSFGNAMFSGTAITTTVAIDLFKFNEQTSENYKKLNALNANTSGYEFVDPNNYYNRVTYEKIQRLSSQFKFNIAPLPSDSNHKLTLGLAPSVNYIIPQDVLSKMKETIWLNNKNNIRLGDSTTDLEILARDYIYYRTNGENIYGKIDDFFKSENFWSGPKYFRKIFTDITLTSNYSYRKNNFNIFELSNTLVFRLDNIGVFSNGKILDNTTDTIANMQVLPLTVYPNETLSMNFFNNILTYSMSIIFTSELDTNFKNYSSLKPEQQILDEVRVMKMVNSHKLGLNIDGKLFEVKLPKGSWFRFSSTTDFWYYKLQKWEVDRENNSFYLYSQNFSVSALMDILSVNLNFKAFNFKSRGYGFELDSGSIKLGYNVTEIPIFWNYFKLNINPAISFDFVVKHSDYYEGTNLYQYNTNYYSGNKLTHSLSFDLTIGQGTDFETAIRFSTRSENSQMYKFFGEKGIEEFFLDLGKSFNFADTTQRKESAFKLKEISVSVTHKLHDWLLSFSYKGYPEKNTTTNRYNWDNVFTFTVEWKLDSENQLMKMFNKTKLNSSYSKGEWQQPVVNLDADKN